MSRWTTTESLPNFSSAQVFAAACLFPRRYTPHSLFHSTGGLRAVHRTTGPREAGVRASGRGEGGHEGDDGGGAETRGGAEGEGGNRSTATGAGERLKLLGSGPVAPPSSQARCHPVA